jgi:hypothetical protein
MNHLPLNSYILIGARAVTHGARRGVMCRPESPDFGAARHGPRSSTACTNKHRSTARRATPALSLACTKTMASIAASCITFFHEPNIPSKHVQVAPHGHHAVTGSPAGRGARDPCHIELLPLHRGRREPKELIRPTCTAQHAHTPVRLKSHDDTYPLVRRMSSFGCRLHVFMLIGAPAVTHGAMGGVMCRPESPNFGAEPHDTPLEHTMWPQAPQPCAEQRLGALSGMHPDKLPAAQCHVSPSKLPNTTYRLLPTDTMP